ncbi:amino acid ABC transporter substrate-binding protein [Verrucomicrobia bacterium LW23]|nr:amino acid ABC transporter substrate-binding protein [Verrucomicrobia bacterium LW23]
MAEEKPPGKPLVFGMELSFAPFEMLDKSGQPTGVSVEMAHALGKFLNRPVEIRNMTFDGLIPALKTGKIDIILSSMTATDERRKSIDFSDTYLNTGLCALVGKNSKVVKAEDLNQQGVTVAVRSATTSQTYARDHLPKAKVIVLDEEAACVVSVLQGRADAYIYDQIAILQHWQRHKANTRAILKPIREESWAMGLRQGNTELKDQVNAFLKQFRADGGFDKLGEKYLGEAKKAFAAEGVPFVF